MAMKKLTDHIITFNNIVAFPILYEHKAQDYLAIPLFVLSSFIGQCYDADSLTKFRIFIFVAAIVLSLAGWAVVFIHGASKVTETNFCKFFFTGLSTVGQFAFAFFVEYIFRKLYRMYYRRRRWKVLQSFFFITFLLYILF